MRKINIALFGTGTVGAGCLEIIRDHHDEFVRHYGVDLEVVGTCSREPEVPEKFGLGHTFKSFDEIMADESVDVVIELIGGTGFAYTVVKTALENGKSVVTANKAIMASKGGELLALAEEKGVFLMFGASVGGGIPIIGPLKHSLTANRIDSVLGIVNGTTNYMLTRIGDGLTYDEALKEAQANGFAEANPSADVDGIDAANKIAILASIAFNSRVTVDQVPVEGIRSISPVDLDYARSMGYVIKLLAIANRTENGVDVRVHPTMIPETHQLATVNGVYNAIYVTGDFVDDTMFFGKGAGSGPAASAVMGDVIEVARSLGNGQPPLVGCTCTDSLPLCSMSDLVTQYYIRILAEDKPGVLSATTALFAQYGVSIYSMLQRGSVDQNAQIVYVTHKAKESDLQAALKEIEKLDNVIEVSTCIRVEDL